MFKKKKSILWVMCCKKISILWVILFFKKILWIKYEKLWVILTKVPFFESYSKQQKGSILLNHIQNKKVQFSWVILKKKVQFFESYKKVQFIETCSKKRVQFFESYQKKEVQFFDSKNVSILWVFLKKEVQIFESYWENKGSIIWVIFNSLSHIEKKKIKPWVKLKKAHFLESHFSKKKNSILGVTFKKGFNSLSHIGKKKVQFFESYWENKGSIIWVIFNSLSHIEKKINPWVKLKKVHFLESHFFFSKKKLFLESRSKKKFNSLSHIQKRVQFFAPYSRKRVQFLPSYSKEKSVQVFWVIWKEGSILWVIFKKVQRVQLFESSWKKGSIHLRLFLKRFNPLRHI